MKIALVGTGRMGSLVEALATSRGHDIVARFNRSRPLAAAEAPEALQGADVFIDFSLPSVVLDHLSWYCRWRQPAVVGVTGWYDALPQVEQWVTCHGACVLYAPNFSLGVQLVLHALRGLGGLLDQMPEYDIALHESHHTGKADRPSGTALLLAQAVLRDVARKTRVASGEGPIDPEALQIASSRIGSVFGRHALTIDSPFDQITISHAAKNRQGFALGALQAAQWLPGRQGLFTLEDCLADLLQ